MVAEFQKHGVVPLLADFTAWDSENVEFLKEQYNRSNLPVNVIYSPDPATPPLILPEFLSQDHVKDGIQLVVDKAKTE